MNKCALLDGGIDKTHKYGLGSFFECNKHQNVKKGANIPASHLVNLSPPNIFHSATVSPNNLNYSKS